MSLVTVVLRVMLVAGLETISPVFLSNLGIIKISLDVVVPRALLVSVITLTPSGNILPLINESISAFFKISSTFKGLLVLES